MLISLDVAAAARELSRRPNKSSRPGGSNPAEPVDMRAGQ
jgi:hypothetical protein